MLEDSFGEVVTREDQCYIVDKNDMVSVYNYVVNCFTVNQAGSAYILWEDPLAVLVDWMSWGHLKSTLHETDSLLDTIWDIKPDQALHISKAHLILVHGRNLITSNKIFD